MRITDESLLVKFSKMFPTTFVECIKQGVTWLCNHNGISYQSSIMIKTDNTVYATLSPSILRVGLIDVDQPLKPVVYYDVRNVVEAKDSVNGHTIYDVELDYKYPVGIKVSLVPIFYFEPRLKLEDKFYTKDAINLLCATKEEVSLLATKEEVAELTLATTEINKNLQERPIVYPAMYFTKSEIDARVLELNKTIQALTDRVAALETPAVQPTTPAPEVTTPTE